MSWLTGWKTSCGVASLGTMRLLAAIVAISALVAAPASAAVVITDGFDDADRDNDGTTDDGNETPVASNDGINWYAINGTTSSGTIRQKPGLTIADDSAGIGSGNALFVEAIGSNGEFMGVFDNSVELGAGLGSTVTFSFDFRVQALLPISGEIRFGVYADSDNEFGTPSTNSDGTPTVWGQSDGNFDRQNPGANGDLGVFARVQMGVSGSLDGGQTRIADEDNVNNILGGSGDSDLIRRADAGAFGVINDFSNRTYAFEMEFLRNPPTDSGETIQTTLRMTDPDGVLTELSGQQPASTDDVATTSVFDYFVMLSTVDVDYVFDNFSVDVTDVAGLDGDFNLNGVVDAADYTVWRDAAGPQSDYDLWANNFGNTSPPSAVGVPEPAAATLLALAGLGLGRRR